jgi:hypothetical protein
MEWELDREAMRIRDSECRAINQSWKRRQEERRREED